MLVCGDGPDDRPAGRVLGRAEIVVRNTWLGSLLPRLGTHLCDTEVDLYRSDLRVALIESIWQELRFVGLEG